jgi:pyruvate,water dikinase
VQRFIDFPEKTIGAELIIPEGFSVLPAMLWEYLFQTDLLPRIEGALDSLYASHGPALGEASRCIRHLLLATPLPRSFQEQILDAYLTLGAGCGVEDPVVLVRAAAPADLGTVLRGAVEAPVCVKGAPEVVEAVREVFVSLFDRRAVANRLWDDLPPIPGAIAVTVQRVVRNDVGVSGLAFTPGAGPALRDMVFVSAGYGLPEALTHGMVSPDEFCVHKPTLEADRPAVFRRSRGDKSCRIIYGGRAFGGGEVDGPWVVTEAVPEHQQLRFCLTDAEIERLARELVAIEGREKAPLEIEWAKDGVDGRFYLLQVRPRTVEAPQRFQTLERYHLPRRGRVLTRGRSVGQRIGAGPARIIRHVGELGRFQPGDVIVADMTAPDWEPFMRHAAAVVINRGGRTCHTCIIAREMGIPAVVGCKNATEVLTDGEEITVSCAEGDIGFIYAGRLEHMVRRLDLEALPELPVKIMINTGNPERALDFQNLPSDGVGSARLEFIISRIIGIHPKALMELENQPEDVRERIRRRAAGYSSPIGFYIDKLAEGIATLAVAFFPRRVVVRLSDFKSNEYANMIGGSRYEPCEANPMLGFRGAARYLSETFRCCFELECEALRKVQGDMGLCNVDILVPFVRTVEEGRKVVELLEEHGLKRGHEGLRVLMMCELPSNALLADQFLEHFDGFSIGSNDLTQLTLGLDRDSGIVAPLFDERDPAVKALLRQAIVACHRAGKSVGVCGQGASDHPDFVRWLVEEGVDSVCINPDSVVKVWLTLAGRSV